MGVERGAEGGTNRTRQGWARQGYERALASKLRWSSEGAVADRWRSGVGCVQVQAASTGRRSSHRRSSQRRRQRGGQCDQARGVAPSGGRRRLGGLGGGGGAAGARRHLGHNRLALQQGVSSHADGSLGGGQRARQRQHACWLSGGLPSAAAWPAPPCRGMRPAPAPGTHLRGQGRAAGGEHHVAGRGVVGAPALGVVPAGGKRARGAQRQRGSRSSGRGDGTAARAACCQRGHTSS